MKEDAKATIKGRYLPRALEVLMGNPVLLAEIAAAQRAEYARLLDFYNKGVVNSFAEMISMARYQKSNVTFGDTLIDKIRNDKRFQKFQETATGALRSGNDTYFDTVRFGSKEDGTDDYRNELFWLLRNAGITATKTYVNGKMVVHYHIHDKFDATPDPRRSLFYNYVNLDIDTAWHDLGWSYPVIDICF